MLGAVAAADLKMLPSCCVTANVTVTVPYRVQEHEPVVRDGRAHTHAPQAQPQHPTRVVLEPAGWPYVVRAEVWAVVVRAAMGRGGGEGGECEGGGVGEGDGGGRGEAGGGLAGGVWPYGVADPSLLNACKRSTHPLRKPPPPRPPPPPPLPPPSRRGSSGRSRSLLSLSFAAL